MSGPEMSIRLARPGDEDGIAQVFGESAEHHARLDPERYVIPERTHVVARYQHGRQHGAQTADDAITLAADEQGKIIGFVDAQLKRPSDAMHRNMLYCNISEIAVSLPHRRKGAGRKLLAAAENWARRSGGVHVLGIPCQQRRSRGILQGRHWVSWGGGYADETSLSPIPG